MEESKKEDTGSFLIESLLEPRETGMAVADSMFDSAVALERDEFGRFFDSRSQNHLGFSAPFPRPSPDED